ncbi:MAG TPA: hypothetical protein PKL69_01850 [Agitococcus sp.]|nr:hypothetical protein [Agitococcus sp.]HMV60011.1 hypothetical protein [Agitococcus sp.]HMX99447.1 hypothetical protein [Agitococcus sp.]HNA20594.1 hypothetical protein [Agitococcus sp.]HNC02393.1 hypothetical protein [Agitococcus sp.]
MRALLMYSTKLYFLLSIWSVSFVANAEDANSIVPSSVFNMASSAKTDAVKKDIDENKPRLENYASYNDFLNAMYVYNKTQEDNIKPRIIIDLPTKPDHQPEYTFLEKNADVTGKGETIPDVVPEQQNLK